ncbi:MAG: phosphatidate cytidylyltransferase [Pirellulales bacterium]
MLSLPVVQVAIGVVAVMAIGSVARLIAVRAAAPEVKNARLKSLATWWGVALLVLAAALLGKSFAVVLFLVVSLIALREFFNLRRDVIRQPSVRWAAYALVPLSYLCVLLGWEGAFLVCIPAAGLVVLATAMIVSGQTSNYPSAVGETYWGLLLTSYAPAHAVLLFCLPAEGNPVAGPAGWFLILLLLTETSDIVQALVGRRIGRRTIAPRISPHKTWAGLVGGLVGTSLLAALLSPWLTPWSIGTAIVAGLLVCAAGFLGDLNISGIKRACGVKDTSALLPGQGGMLDRIDSLSFAAPAFFWFVVAVQLAAEGRPG